MNEQYVLTATLSEITEGPSDDTIPAKTALQRLGPVVEATLTCLTADPGVRSVSGCAMIDTGAMQTAIDTAAAKELRLQVVGETPSVTASGKTTSKIYAGCKIVIPDFYTIERDQIMSVDVADMYQLDAVNGGSTTWRLIAIIGRDFLESCQFFYDGTKGSFSLLLTVRAQH